MTQPQLSPETLARIQSLTQQVELDDNPLLSDMPEWFRGYRGQQGDIIRDIITSFRSYPVTVLDAPTGTGKTVIGESVRRLVAGQSRAIYLCSSLSLQDQFLRDYPYAKVLKGRSNYTPLLDVQTTPGKSTFSREVSNFGLPDCSDCTYDKSSRSCLWCSQFARCPYQVAKVQALSSPISVLNTSYFLTETNGPGRFMASKPAIVIVDECDCLEKELMNYVSVSISKSRLAKLGISGPEKLTVQSSWEAWLEDTAIPVVRSKLQQVRNRKKNLSVLREERTLARILEGLQNVRQGLETGGWIYTGDRERVEFKPVLVDEIGYEKFWKHLEGVKVLCMSASVINSERMLRDTGYTGKYAEFKLASTFPVENRLVKVWPVANMSKKSNERGQLIDACKSIIARHPNDRVLMHGVSYDLSRHIMDVVTREVAPSGRRTYSYADASGRSDALTGYTDTPASILIAPSMDRGIDLPDDLCRVQVICKVPFPYLGDRQVSARLYARGGSDWYAMQTVRTLVQMTGRGVRHAEDWCYTYILDSQFWDNVWERNKWLFPKWWRDSVRRIDSL